MAKSAKHKKIRKQEKAKTQLKGKSGGVTKLGKTHQNLVQPILKTKKILVREQLAQKSTSDDVVYTKRNQSFQDVLSSLNHHNLNIKKEGLRGLEELVTSQNNILDIHLDRILEKIAALTYDEEGSIRKENLKVAEIIFSRVNENQVKPFWNLMLMHVKCTLTSLNSVIRYSSLSFLQLLISYFPKLVCGSLHIILPNLLGLISSTSGSEKLNKNKKTVRLKVEISGKHADINERLLVLSLIAECLDLRKNASNSGSASIDNRSSLNNNIQHRFRNERLDGEQHIKQTVMQNNYLSLYHPWGYCTSSTATSSSQNNTDPNGGEDYLSAYNGSIFSSSFSTNVELPMDHIWTLFIHSCLSVLCETWVEVGPSNSSNDAKTSGLKRNQHTRLDSDIQGNQDTNASNSRAAANLSKNAVDVLTCIMRVMKHLVGGTISVENRENPNTYTGEESWRSLRKAYGPNIVICFLRWLPFSAVQDSQHTAVAGLNLQLFYVAAQLRIFEAKMMTKFENYLNWLIKKESLDAERISLILKILSCLNQANIGDLATKFICHALASGHDAVVHIFLSSKLNPNISSINENGMLKSLSWDKVCEQIMQSMKHVTPDILKLLTLVSIRKLSLLKTVMDSNLSRFLNFCKSQNTAEAWEQTIRVFYYCNSLDTFISGADLNDIPLEVRETLKSLQYYRQ